jgi:hypothetical protein
MAFNRPDPLYNKAKKLIESLGNEGNDPIIKYYIERQERIIKDQKKKLDEYQEVFDLMSKFLPSGRPIVYGGSV